MNIFRKKKKPEPPPVLEVDGVGDAALLRSPPKPSKAQCPQCGHVFEPRK